MFETAANLKQFAGAVSMTRFGVVYQPSKQRLTPTIILSTCTQLAAVPFSIYLEESATASTPHRQPHIHDKSRPFQNTHSYRSTIVSVPNSSWTNHACKKPKSKVCKILTFCDSGALMIPKDTCRICSAPGEPGQPLFYPCKCSGTIQYIHQDWSARLYSFLFYTYLIYPTV